MISDGRKITHYSETTVFLIVTILQDLLPTLDRIFKTAQFFGITSYGFTVAFCWSFVLFLMLVTMEACAIWKLIRLPSSGGQILIRIGGAIFYGNALISLLLSSKFINSWQNLSSFWLRAETASGLNFEPDVRIRKRMIFVTSLVASCALIEHVLSMISATGFDFPPEEFFKRYILMSHGFVIKPHEYRLWVAIPIFILSKLATALWNFQDLIIILISMGLTFRYQKLNQCVYYAMKNEKKISKPKKIKAEFSLSIQQWRRLREAYVRHATIVRIVDDQLGPLVLLSNINNMYFICLQIFNGIHKENESVMNRTYYLLSLSWLLFRACSVVLAGADVRLHSQHALKYLRCCPRSAYNIEIKRLQYQLTHSSVGLSGMGFFLLRRKLLLEVAATIMKYELVLIEYDT